MSKGSICFNLVIVVLFSSEANHEITYLYQSWAWAAGNDQVQARGLVEGFAFG